MKKPLVMFVVATAAAVTAASVFTATASTGTANASAPAAVTGSLPTGVRLTKLDVYAVEDDAQVRLGETVSRLKVPATFVQSGSTYTLRIDPRRVPDVAIDAGGVVDLELRPATLSSTWMTFVSARLVENKSAKRVEWVDPTEVLPRVPAPQSSRRGEPTLPSVSSRSGLALPRTEVADLGKPLPATMRSTRTDVSPAACDYKYVKDSDRSVTIATSYPLGASKSWLDVTHTRGGTYGLAFNTGSGFAARGSRFAEGGWGATWPRSKSMRSYRIGVNYHFYKSGCGGSYWSPHIETGGATSNTANLTRPKWNKLCDRVGHRVTWRRFKSSGHAYEYSQGVKFKSVIGIDLSASKRYSSDHTLFYFIDGRPKKLCGNNDYPSYASKIVERLRQG